MEVLNVAAAARECNCAILGKGTPSNREKIPLDLLAVRQLNDDFGWCLLGPAAATLVAAPEVHIPEQVMSKMSKVFMMA